jgi:hypothetical protein
MKVLKAIFVFILVVSVLSCNSDDDSVQFVLNNANIAGTYSVTRFNSTEVETQDVNGLTVESTFTNIGKTFNSPIDPLRFIFTVGGEISGRGAYVNTTMTVVNNVVTEEPVDGIVNIDENARGTFNTNNSLNIVTVEFEESGIAGIFEATNYSQSGITLRREIETTVNNIRTITTQEIVLVKE